MFRSFNRYLHIIFAISLSLSAFSQSLSESAKLSFAQKDYKKALPLYEQLVKQYNTSSTYAYRYGVCLYETKTDINTATSYLKLAVKRGLNDAYLYLGKCDTYNYFFQNALNNYNTYIKKIRPRGNDLEEVNELIEKATLGLKMLQHIEKIEVYKVDTVSMNLFYEKYNLSSEVGTIINNDDVTIKDSKGPIFINEKKNALVYAAKSKDDSLDLKLMNKYSGDWIIRSSIDSTVNTSEPENYPFMTSDGETLYFSSRGHNSIGGYDLYTTRINSNTGNFFYPVNLGFPFNSPDDDMLLTIDDYNNIGQFASTRGCSEGRVVIYSFIISKEKRYVDSTNDSILANEARLLVDINNLATPPKITQDGNFKLNFRFEIKDDLVYNDTSDFKSELAILKYNKLIKEELALDWTKSELEKERKLIYENKSFDKDKVLRMEQQIPIKINLIEQLKKDIRNEEISVLSNK